MSNTNPNDSLALVIKQAITNWNDQIKQVNKFINKYDADVYNQEIAPGRNRYIYVLGHLVAVNDIISKLIGLGDKQYPELTEIFITSPDKAVANIPSFDELKEKWNKVNSRLDDAINKMKPEEWLERHTSVSPEDFANEPHRNKLNILLSRTSHTAYHVGQLALLKVEESVL